MGKAETWQASGACVWHQARVDGLRGSSFSSETKLSVTGNLVRIGVNYRFGVAAPVVMASY